MINCKNQTLKRIINVGFPLITILFVILVWHIASRLVNVEIIIPMPINVIREFFVCLTSLKFFKTVFATILRSVICFLLALLFGVLLSYFSSKFDVFKRLIAPIISILKTVPTMSVILIILMWIDYEIAPIVITFLIAFPLVYENAFASFSSLDGKILQMLKTYGVSNSKIVKNYSLPTVLSGIFKSIGAQVSLSLKVVISAEVLSETAVGLGTLMRGASVNLYIGRLFAYSIFAIIIGALLEFVLGLIYKKAFKGGL